MKNRTTGTGAVLTGHKTLVHIGAQNRTGNPFNIYRLLLCCTAQQSFIGMFTDTSQKHDFHKCRETVRDLGVAGAAVVLRFSGTDKAE